MDDEIITLPNMPKPKTEARVFKLQYHDAGQRVVYATNQAQILKEGLTTISRTDAHGIITYVNRIFVEMSGFRERELIGMPHCILRHPDMPAEIFAKMWQKLNAGEPWHGYIKNLCKNGNYFWINANITATIVNDHIVGYSAVGRAIHEKFAMQMEAMYAEMINHEASLASIAPSTPIEEESEKKRSFFGWKI